MDRRIPYDPEEIMTQSHPQQVQTAAVQSTRIAAGTFAASMQSMRTVALSLLVDRALSA
jgi:hypothetical protein